MKCDEERFYIKLWKTVIAPPFYERDPVFVNNLDLFARFLAMYINKLKIYQVLVNESEDGDEEIPTENRFFPHDLLKIKVRLKEKEVNSVKKLRRKFDKFNKKNPYSITKDEMSRKENKFCKNKIKDYYKKHKKKLVNIWRKLPRIEMYSSYVYDFDEADVIRERNERKSLDNGIWKEYGKVMKVERGK
jgi:hypothetical protein